MASEEQDPMLDENTEKSETEESPTVATTSEASTTGAPEEAAAESPEAVEASSEENSESESEVVEAKSEEAAEDTQSEAAPEEETAAETTEETPAEAEPAQAASDSSDEESDSDEEKDSEDEKPELALGPPNESHKCYVVNVYSGHEHRAKNSLEERVKSIGKQNLISEVIVPEETVVELVKGQRRTSKRRFFPGYIIVRMELTDDAWHIIKDIPKITGFVGDKRKPIPIPDAEIKRMTNRINEGVARPKPKVSFVEGENVRVIDGPFLNFSGTVEDVNLDKAKVRVLVSIFGRSTPVELDFVQVEKI